MLFLDLFLVFNELDFFVSGALFCIFFLVDELVLRLILRYLLIRSAAFAGITFSLSTCLENI